jgi:2-polyprenyl-3-methyl-5-hydroxy-6-metoxy-1,4-benzoquinol methylase
VSNVSHCLICGNADLRYRFRAKGYEILACPCCGFNQASQTPTDSELERLYAELHVSHTRYRDEQSAQRENISRLQFIQRFLSTGAIVLDAGCATGDFLVQATNKYSMYGVDISPGAVDVARRRLPALVDRLHATRLETINALDWPSFDAICLWDVIEHVRNPVELCRTLLALLKPGGYLFLSTPDMGALTARVMGPNWAFMIPPLHLGYFSRSSLMYLFSRRTPARICAYCTRGKWTSLAFLFYKLNQISCWLAPPPLLRWLSESKFGRLNLYVPTNDIAYLAIQKPVIGG